MGSYSPDSHTFIPTGASRVPLAISPLRHKTPSLPVMRHSPSVQTLNFHPLGLQPLNSFRAKLHSRPGTESIIEDADATPRPLRIKKIRKSPSVPFGGMQDFKPPPKPTRHGPPPSRNFLGLSFPPQPKPRSSSAGVLSIDKTGGTGTSLTNGFKADTIRRASSHRQSERKELPGAGMAWLQRAKTVRPMSTLSPPDTNKTLNDIQNAASLSPLPGQEDNRKSSYQVSKSRDSSGDATAGSSFRSSSYQSLDDEPRTPKAHDGSVSKRVKERNSKMRRVASASEPHEDGEKNGLDYKDSKISKEYTPKGPVDKIPTRGWKEKMFPRDFFTRGGGSTSPKKDAKVKGRERTYSTSSATIVKTVHLPRPLTAIGHPTPLRVDIPSNHSWCEHSSRQSRREAWQLDGHAAASSLAGSGIRSRTNFNDSVLGIFEGNIGGMGRTRLKKTGQWKPPILRLEMAVVAETEKVPITYHGGDGNDKVVWVSVELDGAVDKGTDCFEGSKVGLDVAVLMDISAYTSSTSFVNMKLQAKRIVEAMETSRDRVAVMTFPVTSSNTEPIPVRRDAIHVLNSSGSVAKKQLMDDITSLVQNKWDMDPASRNVREAVLASVRKLKGMPRDTARYGTHRHGHLFLLTTKLDAGEIELLPEVFFGEIQIHIIGIGALFWPRNEMGASGWCMPTGTLGPRPILPKATLNKRDDSVVKSEKEELGIEEIIQLLRMAVDLGALYDLNIELRAGEHCSIRAVMGDLKYAKILPGEKRSILIQVQVGDMPTPDSGYDLDGHHEVIPRWVILERQLEATLGELKGRLLSVKLTYGHSNFSGDTLFSTEKHLDISRFAEDSLWRFSPTGNKLVNKEKSPPLTPIIAEDYVKKVLIQRVASMHSSPSRALRAVQEIANNTICRVTSFDEISRELVYRDKVEQKFRATRSSYSQSSNEELLIDLVDRSNDRTPTPRNSLEGAGIIMNSTPPPISTLVLEAAQMTPANRDCRYRGSRELHNEDRAPFIATMDSSPDTERPDIDPEDEAQRIWQEIKLRQRGVSSGSIKRRSVRSKKVASFYGLEQLKDKYNDQENGDMLSTVYSSSSAFGQESEVEGERYRGIKGDREIRCHSGQEALDSLVTLRDIRETDFGPWAL